MRPIANLGTIAQLSEGVKFLAWLSRHADLIAAAGAFTAIYFLLIRKP